MSNSKLHSLSSRVLENGYCKTVIVINQIHTEELDLILVILESMSHMV